MDVKTFGRLVNKYFNDCKMADPPEFPDENGMLAVLGISDEEYASYDEKPEYAQIKLWAYRMRNSWLERASAATPAGCKVLLAQNKNGGYTDKPQSTKERSWTVKVKGIDFGDTGKEKT